MTNWALFFGIRPFCVSGICPAVCFCRPLHTARTQRMMVIPSEQGIEKGG